RRPRSHPGGDFCHSGDAAGPFFAGPHFAGPHFAGPHFAGPQSARAFTWPAGHLFVATLSHETPCVLSAGAGRPDDRRPIAVCPSRGGRISPDANSINR